MLKIYNSVLKRKQKFVPLEPGKVRMYVCGITVYDDLHVGHARMLVVFDMIVRHLRVSGYDVTYVRNITDVDDKIIRRAAENGESCDALTARVIAAMHADCAALNVSAPDFEPRATQYIDEIVAMIAALIERGHAYPGANGDVYFSVSSFAPYGRLSGKQLEDLRAGARIDVDEAKRDPLDFVLWKAAKPGEPSWDSPWGAGRPGWHIECSAMSTALLGAHFDLHGGGMDLKFPHHENEIAQSCAATGEAFVNYWVHNGFVQVRDEKMSKSLGNFFTVRTLLELYQPEELRYFLLQGHYRSPLNYSERELDSARASLTRLYTTLNASPPTAPAVTGDWTARFDAAMNDDFNTPEALAVLFDAAREANRQREQGDLAAAGAVAAVLCALANRLGLLENDPGAYLKAGRGSSDGLSDADIDAQIAARKAARASRDWAESDRIRDALAGAGIVLEDSAGGTTWRRK